MNTVSCFVKRYRFSVLAGFAGFCSTVYLGTGMLGVTFLSDDIGLITWGKQATGPGFWKPWTGNRLTGEAGSPRYFRPLTLLSHGLDAALWGWTPSGHQLTNLILPFLKVRERVWWCGLLVYSGYCGVEPDGSPWSFEVGNTQKTQLRPARAPVPQQNSPSRGNAPSSAHLL